MSSRQLFSAWLVALGLVAAELAVAFFVRRSQLVGFWEAQWGTTWLAPTLILGASACALIGVLGIALLAQAERPRARVSLSALAGTALALTAWGVGGGRHLASWGARGGFALLTGILALVLAWILAPRLGRAVRERPGAVATGALGLVLLLELSNRFVLVRLYPAFHHALALASLAAAPAIALGFANRSPPNARRSRLMFGGVVLVLIGAGASLKPSAERLAHFDNYRVVVLENAPIAAEAVQIAARIVPPAPIAECGEDDALCLPVAEPSAARSLDLRGRDLLVVTIDALRADHVGGYGYGRATTPNIDALIRDGATFTHAYAQTPHTSYSITSLMTGKYIRPLLMQGAGDDSDTWASLLRTYGFRTAAFYPPAVFFIDPDRFVSFRDHFLGFEYRKVEFLEGSARVAQVTSYLAEQPRDQRLFVWVHLFAPHEPYEAHPEHAFGDRDVDRYDSEVAWADTALGDLVRNVRRDRPNAVVIVAADHGEEFGEHGGRYHGTTVYEEQVRVPLVISAPGAIAPRRIDEVVQSIDLLPTLLSALDIPRPPRLRGRDLGPLLSGARASGAGFAYAETEEQSLLAEGVDRLICQKKVGACQLFDESVDPGETTDRSGERAGRFRELRTRLRELAASHGRFEERGLRAEGKGWPAAILRGAAGDGDAAEDVAALLDDADLAVRRKAASVLFDLRRPETAAPLRLALTRDEDPEVRAWSALALTRFDQGAPLVNELIGSNELKWKRLAALALAETGDKRGEGILVEWWKDAAHRDYARSRELLAAFAKIRSKDAVWPLVLSLDDVRLRPYLAETLAAIGDEAGRIPLAKAFAIERYQGARRAIAQALVSLGAEAEMAESLVRFLGVPDPLPDGLDIARRAKILEHIGGPDERDRRRLEKNAGIGVKLQLIVPRGGNGKGVRVLVRARSEAKDGGSVRIGAPFEPLKYDKNGKPVKERNVPRIHPDHQVAVPIPSGPQVERYAELPQTLGARAGRPLEVVVFADAGVSVESIALVPLADELPPPPPEPWRPN